ncbi:ATP-binding protein [Natronospira bacteriovora]|uniref:histidine kinase n=1 Tax=Natronospira bacteriovora TaxID=3069753 RepID=A0ABU0W8Q8_9GAMM|nr:ATP-binding protein [Natronospira sp. AB-CW4]MDQ2070417.1 ATP-binding protein [Natronospira sp. AB-CW4]
MTERAKDEQVGGRDTPPRADLNLRWRSLRLLNLFRAGLALSFLMGFYLQPAGGMLGASQEGVFLFATLGLGLLAIVTAVTLRRQWPNVRIQAIGQLSIDCALYFMILWASGGLETGLGNLLFIPVAGASLILGSRLSITLAALITLVMLFQEILLTWSPDTVEPRFTHAGILGALFMIMSVVGAHLSRRLRESEALALKRGLDLRNLAELNDYIIQQLRTGIVVVDHQDRLQLINGSAAQFLGITDHYRNVPVRNLSRQLTQLVEARRRKPYDRPPSFTAADGETLVVPRFTELGDPDNPGTLIFLEDGSLQSQRAQEMKLAALGRFTASIAHELRNPLSAIRHANQLLAESPRLQEEERKLNGIIERHTERVNRIIETVLKLSRREQTDPRRMNLSEWARDFRREMTETGKLPESRIGLTVPEEDIWVHMDPDHLYQVVQNLVDNALLHGEDGPGERVHLRITYLPSRNRPLLEVVDHGPGIPPDEAEHIFEPFYTASPRGTGLGLFVARELCDCNRARLEYRRQGNDTVFRIVFADPERWLT